MPLNGGGEAASFDRLYVTNLPRHATESELPVIAYSVQ